MTDEEFREAWHPEGDVRVNLLIECLARTTGALMLAAETHMDGNRELADVWYDRAEAMSDEFLMNDELFRSCMEEAIYRVEVRGGQA